MKKKLEKKGIRRNKLFKECKTLVYEILYAKTGETASYNSVTRRLSKYTRFFGFEEGSRMKTKELENFKIFLSAVNKEARANKQLPFKIK